MNLLQEDMSELDRGGLRRFGLLLGAMCGLFFGVLLPWIGGFGWPAWPWIVAAVLAVWSIAIPDTLRGLYWLWMRIGLVLGAAMSFLILGVIYLVLITPLGLGFRLAGKDAMSRRLEPDAVSYRVPTLKRNRNHLERPF